MNHNHIRSYELLPHMELWITTKYVVKNQNHVKSYESQPHIESWITTTDVKYDLKSKVIRTN